MDTDRFDRATRTVSLALSRRGLTSALGLTALGIPSLAAAKKKKKKIKRNEFGCVEVGNRCKNAGQCCSGICTGKKGKKTCQAHDTGDCQADQDACLSEDDIRCTTSAGSEGICLRTTGNARYCAAIESGGVCFPCNTDADCQEFCGPTAACIVCEARCEEAGGTICAGLDECTFPLT
jgi:hypothetical protein